MQNYNSKLKINKIQTPVIASPEVSGRSNLLPILSLRVPKRRDEAISKMNYEE